MKYLALLRGINVGGNNIIKMKDLKEIMIESGFQNVVTYIQSGNVIFETDEKESKKITERLESLLSKKFNYQASIVVLNKNQLQKILMDVPNTWKGNDNLRCYLAFIKSPTTSDEVLPYIILKDRVDFVAKGVGVVYLSTLLSGLTRSGFTKLASTKIYKELTMRNYNTAQKLLILME
jgi:uncharacterized protein (DUF1697 family)